MPHRRQAQPKRHRQCPPLQPKMQRLLPLLSRSPRPQSRLVRNDPEGSNPDNSCCSTIPLPWHVLVMPWQAMVHVGLCALHLHIASSSRVVTCYVMNVACHVEKSVWKHAAQLLSYIVVMSKQGCKALLRS